MRLNIVGSPTSLGAAALPSALGSVQQSCAPPRKAKRMPGPLHGYRIVDLTSNVAGPLATMILGDQGADVIKVEPPDGDHTRAGANRRGGFSANFLNNNR